MSLDASDSEFIETKVRQEVNRSLAAGGVFGAALGLGAMLILVVFSVATRDSFFIAPAVFAGICGGYSWLIRTFGKAGRVHGATGYWLMLPFVCLPSLLFGYAELALPAGAATFITGPFSYVYLFVLTITGFLFSVRVPIIAGFLVTAQYMAFSLIAQDDMALLTGPEPLVLRDLTEPFVYLNKGFVMIATGFAVGGTAYIAKRLLRGVLAAEREKAKINRLFGEYVSDEVREKILEQGGEFLSERKEVVVLFSDLRDFSGFSERHEPEEIVTRLNAYFERMVQAIRGEGGVVDKFVGDAIMATFGGATELADPAGAAVRAAKGMRAALVELNESWHTKGIEPFANGIGIHVGDVVQGPIGSMDRKEFTVIGDAVNTASRLEGLTKGKGIAILISQAVYAELGAAERETMTSLGEATVKGRREPIVLYGCE